LDIVTHLLMGSVIFMMFGVGLRTPFGEVIEVAKQPGLVIRGVLANFLVVPLLFYLTLKFLPFRPDVAIGLLIMAAVPIAPMAPPFVGMAKGDVPYAVGLMAIVAVLCVPLTPLILALCLPRSEAGLALDISQIILTLLTAQLIPIGLGMATKQYSKTWTERLLRAIPMIGQVGLAISVVAIISLHAGMIIALGLLPILAVVLSLIGCTFVGDVMMRGESRERRRSLGISTAVRNVALGLLIVNSNYAGTPTVAIVLVFGVLSMIFALAYGRLMILRS
jgi:BASS family bile acid:Na+ symporter